MYYDWSCLSYTCMFHWTPDCTYDLIVHLTIALTDNIIVHSYLAFYINLIPVYIFSLSAHFICTCTFPFYFTHSLGHFLTTLDLHIQILDALFYYSGVRWDCTCCEELKFLYLFGYSYFLFIPIASVVSLILYQYQSLFHSLFNVIMCGCLYVILQWS